MKMGWNDLLAAAGLAAIGVGLWMVNIPAALITVGSLMLILAVLSAIVKGRS